VFAVVEGIRRIGRRIRETIVATTNRAHKRRARSFRPLNSNVTPLGDDGRKGGYGEQVLNAKDMQQKPMLPRDREG